MEIFHAITEWISAVMLGVSSNYWLFVFLVFLVCVGEAVFILGLFVPSTPVLLMAGGIIAEGRLPFWEVYFAAVIGAIAFLCFYQADFKLEGDAKLRPKIRKNVYAQVDGLIKKVNVEHDQLVHQLQPRGRTERHSHRNRPVQLHDR